MKDEIDDLHLLDLVESVGLDLGVAQVHVVLARELLDTRAEKAQLERKTQVQHAIEEVDSFGAVQRLEPIVHLKLLAHHLLFS